MKMIEVVEEEEEEERARARRQHDVVPCASAGGKNESRSMPIMVIVLLLLMMMVMEMVMILMVMAAASILTALSRAGLLSDGGKHLPLQQRRRRRAPRQRCKLTLWMKRREGAGGIRWRRRAGVVRGMGWMTWGWES